MPLSGDLTTITVTASFPNIAGQPQSGRVVFDPQQPIMDATGKVIFEGAATCNVFNGVMQPVVLPCTDNAGANPSSFQYKISEFIGNSSRVWYTSLPHTLGSTVDLSSLSPTSAAPASSAFASNNTWTGTNTFQGETVVQTPVNSGDAATKAYVDAHTGAVSSVNGHTGVVVLAASDVGADASGAAAAAQAASLQKASNLSDVANAGTARTNLGLGTVATHAATDFLASSGGTVTGNLAVNGNADAEIISGLVIRDQVSNFYTSNGASSATITFAANPTAGAKVLVALANVSATPTLIDNGVTPTTFTRDQGNTLGTNNIHIFRADNITLPASGSYQINVTSGGFVFAAVAVSYLGLRAGGPLTSSTGHSTGIVTGLSSLNSNGVCSGLVFGAVSDANTSVHSVSVGGPFTSQAASSGGSGAPGGFGAADWLDDSVPALQLPAWTFGSSSEWEASAVTYQPVFSIVGSPAIYGSDVDVIGLTAGSGGPVFRVLNSASGMSLRANDDSSVITAHNTLDDGTGNVTVSGTLDVSGPVHANTGSAIVKGGTPSAVIISGNSDTHQYSNFELADGVFPLDQNPGGHYWAFSHRVSAHALQIFNYNGAGTYLTALQAFESGELDTVNNQLDDGIGNMRVNGASQAIVFKPTGLTGATAASRYVGASSGAPVSGTFVAGDYILDTSINAFRICTTGGSPGTWNAVCPVSNTVPVALGTAAAGTATQVSRQDHVHPTTGLMTLQATTGTSGVALSASSSVNLLTWTAPNDGALHRATVFMQANVASNLTGGKVDVSYTGQDSAVHTPQLMGANQPSGYVSFFTGVLVKANTTVALFQETGVSAGSGTVYAEIWGC